MPQAILAPVAFAAFQAGAGVAVSNAILGVGVAGAITHAAVSTALAVGASYAIAKLTPTPPTPKPSSGSIEFKQPLPARFFTYGLVKTAGPVLFLETQDILDNVRLLKITAFGSRELASMATVYINGAAYAVRPGVAGSDGYITAWHQNGSDRGNAWTHLGKNTQAADAQLLLDYPPWTDDHRLRGIPYLYGRFDSCESGEVFTAAFPGGEPQFAAVGGVKVYDPRKDTTNGGSGSHRMTDPTTWEFSDNQRLCTLDWLTWPDGYGKPWARIDWATWVPQIAMADDAIPLKGGGTEKRYRVATKASYDEPRSRVLHRLMEAGDQQLFTTADGLIGSRGGVWQTPGTTLAVESFPEALFTHGVARMDRINEFQLTAMLPSKDYTEFDLEPWSNTADPEFAAGIVRRAPLDLSQVPSNSQAQRLAKIYMSKKNPRWNGQVRTSFAGLDALGAAAVNLTFGELDQPPGTFNGAFWVNGKISFLPDRTGVTFPAASADPAAYDWNAATEEALVPGDEPSISVALTAPADGAIVSGTVTLSATATATAGIAGVQFKNGTISIGSEDTASPYSISWDTTAVTNGIYTLMAVARDTASKTRTSASVTVIVSN